MYRHRCKRAPAEGVAPARAKLDDMTEHKASRTLVKSPPELWAECSDANSLTRHLDQFGEIKITRLEPETAVAWEGERIRGTVRLEPSGWGTKVTLTAIAASVGDGSAEPSPIVAPEHVEPQVTPVAAAAEPVATAVEPESVALPPPVAPPGPLPAPGAEPVSVRPPKRRGFLARLFGRQEMPEPVAITAPEPVAEPEGGIAETEPVRQAEPQPVACVEPELEPVAAVESELEPEPEPPAHEPETRAAPEPSIVDELADAESALIAALDSLGQAHHRPFSRG
jgi:hypothetical protein